MCATFLDEIYLFLTRLPFYVLVWSVWGSYLAVFVLAVVCCVASKRFRTLSKRPFLALTNAYTGVNLAMFLMQKELSEAIITAVLFWVAGYILYGVLCAFTSRPKLPEGRVSVARAAVAETPMPVVPSGIKNAIAAQNVPAAKTGVRLEHAVAVTDKLLSKNLSKTDRQELEKLKNTLAVLQIKGNLTPTEAEILNENFNALLKLMAKYNV